MTTNFSAGTSKAVWHPTKSFWITGTIWLLFLVIALVTGGFAAWLVMFALFVILTALYSLIFGRRSWLGLPHRKGAGGAVGIGFLVLIIGSIVAALTSPSSGTIAPLADAMVAVTTSASPSASPTPTPKYVLKKECFDDGESVVEGTETLVCTVDDKGLLVWMLKKDSTTLIAERAETKRVAAEKMAKEKAAVERVAAEKATSDKAAADEAARIVAEQAAQQAPAADVYYQNCTEARAAGAAPLYIGQPGYRPGMDGDSDGVACEPKR
ncbi:excalibur calcium-binding domain-containing protein [Arthrobacter sp. TWP1-1]|uniref:excalibur calcium-binding domain-containing protein n=1 Tax=Arthrobacter sp. TWP1-1 TaxID=2804568 RepID=UPI003CF29C18